MTAIALDLASQDLAKNGKRSRKGTLNRVRSHVIYSSPETPNVYAERSYGRINAVT